MIRSGLMMLLPLAALAGCTCAPADPGEGAPAPVLTAASSTAIAEARCGALVTMDLGPGVRLQRFRAPIEPTVDVGDRCITLVRVDPGRHRLRLLTALGTGRSRAASTWADEFHLTGVVNASMYLSDQRSVGLMVDGASVNQPSDNPKLGGFLGLDPTRDGLPPVAGFGRDCAGFDLDAIRRDYRIVVQNYRLLDCAGRPIRWQDPKVYSAAAIGVGKEGDVVFIHARTPYSMTDLAIALALPDLALKSAMFVEGGPEASLYVRAPGGVVREIGSYETGFRPDDSNDKFWEIPNVIGFSPR